MMRITPKYIVLINQYAQLPDGPGGTRHYNLASELSLNGVDVTLIIGSAELNTGRQRYAGNGLWEIVSINGVKTVVLKTIPVVGNGLWRVLGMLQFSLSVLIYLVASRLPSKTVVYASTPQPFACFASLIYAKITNKRFVLEIRDLWPESLFSLGLMQQKSITGKLLNMLDLTLVHLSEFVVTLLPQACEYYNSKGIRDKKFVYIPNGFAYVDYELTQHSLAKSNSEQAFIHSIPSQDQHPFVFCYFGALGYANAAHILIETCALLNSMVESSEYKLKIIGAGPEKDKIRQLIYLHNLPNVELLPPVPKSRIFADVRDVMCFIFHLRPADVFRYGISPNKLIDYMILGKPIIFCGDTWPNPLKTAGAAITAQAMNPSNIAEIMLATMRMSFSERERLGGKAREYAITNHSFPVLADKLREALWR